jgi:hypothetical protein
MPPTDRVYIEFVEPAKVPLPTDISMAGPDPRHVWRLAVTSFHFGGPRLKQVGDRFLELIRQSLEIKSQSPGDGEMVLVLAWRTLPEKYNGAGDDMCYRARLILEFMPRSFLAEEPNNGIRPNLMHIARDPGKSEVAKMYREARVTMETNPPGKNWWGEYYRKLLAELEEKDPPDFTAPAPRGHRFDDIGKMYGVMRGELQEITGIKGQCEEVGKIPSQYIRTRGKPAGLTAESLDEAGQHIRDVLRAREVLDKAGAPPITQEEVEAAAYSTIAKTRVEAFLKQGREIAEKAAADVFNTPLKQYYAVDPARSGPNDVNVFKAEPLERPPTNFNVFDAMKLAARQARIRRNEMAPTPSEPISLAKWDRWEQEAHLTTAISKTELPHEATIHDRLMPYRHKE